MMRRRTCLQWLSAPLVLSACGKAPPPSGPQLRLSEVLGGDDTQGYLRALEPREFSFPADHGPHPGFRNEWWYFTGNVDSADGRRFGYQLTFFNSALRPPGTAGSPSAWDSPRAWMAHLAVTDAQGAAHHAVERFTRENPGLAGADAERVWLEDWQLWLGDETRFWLLRAFDASSGIGIDLELRQLKPPVLQGHAGLSQKSPEPGNASYYYSLPLLATGGTLRVGGQEFTVRGQSWLDREWSTSALAPDQCGWNWFSLQFDDGQQLMYYELLDQSGNAHPQSAGNWTTVDAQQIYINPADVVLTPLATWTSPTGTVYVTNWELAYAGLRLRIDAVLQDQWMDLSLPYWEGAVDVSDAATNMPVGRGYLEMVRS
jgi:predicted secreted hydrolase